MKKIIMVFALVLVLISCKTASAGANTPNGDIDEEQALIAEARTIINEVDQILTSEVPVPRNRIEAAIRSINSFERRVVLWLAENEITSVSDRRGDALKDLRFHLVMRDRRALQQLLSE